MIWNLIFAGGFLYLAVVLRAQIRFLKQTRSHLDVRITSLETQIRDLQDRVRRIEDMMPAAKEAFRGISPDRHTAPNGY